MPRLAFFNRQRTRPLNARRLREVARLALSRLAGVQDWDLAFYFVGSRRMAEINRIHLGHEGATDVITFDYNDPGRPDCIAGEIFICIEVAITQAREYRTTWQLELVRYLVHALLHLRGHDDRNPTDRRRMKAVENRLVHELDRRLDVRGLSRRPLHRPGKKPTGTAARGLT